MRFWSKSGSRWKVKQWPWAGPREAEPAGAPTGMGGSTAGVSSSSNPAGNAFSFSPVAAGMLVRWGQAGPRGLSRAARVRGLGTPAGAGERCGGRPPLRAEGTAVGWCRNLPLPTALVLLRAGAPARGGLKRTGNSSEVRRISSVSMRLNFVPHWCCPVSFHRLPSGWQTTAPLQDSFFSTQLCSWLCTRSRKRLGPPVCLCLRSPHPSSTEAKGDFSHGSGWRAHDELHVFNVQPEWTSALVPLHGHHDDVLVRAPFLQAVSFSLVYHLECLYCTVCAFLALGINRWQLSI